MPSGPEAAKVEPALIVINASGALLVDNKLTLTGVAPNAIIFADRPTRAAGHALTVHLLEEWGSTADASFAKDPPNATVSAFSKDGSRTRDAMVVLKNPTHQGDRLTFDVLVLKGADGPASVFIDIIGLPFTWLSFTGVARRTAYRSAMYSAALHPYYGYPTRYYPPRCGYDPLRSAMLLSVGHRQDACRKRAYRDDDRRNEEFKSVQGVAQARPFSVWPPVPGFCRALNQQQI